MPLIQAKQIDIKNVGAAITEMPPELVTMFSRLRVASDVNLLSIRQDTQLRNLIVTEGQISGSGTSSDLFNQGQASTIMNVGTTPGLRRLQSRTAGLYITGNSLLGFITFNFMTLGQPNVVKRVGYYDDQDGIFLQQENGVLSIVLRSSVTGNTETTIAQADWNADKFDGNSAGYAFDQTKCHIFWFAAEWLGVGDVYTGFIYDTIPILAHAFRHPNLRAEPYMRTANLFLSYDIERKLAGGTPDSFRAVCGALKSEGDGTPLGFSHLLELGNERVLASPNIIYPVIIFRLNPLYKNARVKIDSFDFSLSDNNSATAKVYILRNPVFNQGYDTANMTTMPDSSIQYQNNQGSALPATLTVTSFEKVIDVANTSFTKDSFANNSTALNINNFLGVNISNNTINTDLWCLAIEVNATSVGLNSAVVKLWEQL